MKYILVQDNDCHWYVIPKENEGDWNKCLEAFDEDGDNDELPNYAKEVGGSPSRVEFEIFKIN